MMSLEFPVPIRPGARRVHAGLCALALLATLPALALLAGCDKRHGLSLAPDAPPTITLTSGPVDTLSSPQSWLVDIAWTASDPDGRVDHFEYTVDPPTLKQATFALAETAWVSTTENHVTVRFRASQPDSLGPGATASEFHVFALRAVDDRGGVSPLVVRAFYAYTIAPDVRIVSPVPKALTAAQVAVPFRLSWEGSDPDGAGTTQPASWRLRFIPLDGGQGNAYLTDPDSLLRESLATNWQGWRSIGGDTTSLEVGGPEFPPGTRWLAALVAVDEAGAATAYMNLDRNVLVFDVTALGGPRLHVSAPYFDYTTQPSGEGSSLFMVSTEVLAGAALRFQLEGLASAGRTIVGTRWAVDIANFNDETPRTNELTDWSHWSRARTGVVTAEFGPLSEGVHHLWVDTRDDFAARAVLDVKLTCVALSGQRELLVVDDTRLEVDKFGATGCPNVYTQVWPSAAELDSFLFARGGVPWRCARNPVDAITPPGLFAGWPFDTTGTRRGLEDPANAVTLSTLGRYRHVLWLTDQTGATYGPTTDPRLYPTTALRAMSAPGHANPLATYVQGGGQVWLAGGGAGLASLADFNRLANDVAGTMLFTFDAGELVPGRLLYDFAHVRSALGVTKAHVEPQRSSAARGGWSGHGPAGTLSAPDYSRMPAVLRLRTPDSDPIPPTRLSTQASLYYPTVTAAEYVAAPNATVEDMDPDPASVRLESTQDTLYEVAGPALLTSPAPAMVYYHGRDNAPFLYTGFDLWSWTRADAQAFVDFVLGDVWGMTRSGPRSAALRSPSGALGARRPGAGGATWHRLDPPRARP